MSKRWLTALLLFCMGLIVCFPQICGEAVREALKLCGTSVIPALFPFFVCMQLLLSLGAAKKLSSLLYPITKKVFSLSESGTEVWIMGLLGGYPSGAAAVKLHYESGRISSSEAGRLCLFCNHASPAMLLLIGGVGVFGEIKYGVLLLAAHWLGSMLIGIWTRKDVPFSKNSENIRSIPFSAAFSESVKNAVSMILQICGFITVFRIVIAFLPHGAEPFWGVLELTSGVISLKQISLARLPKLMLCAFYFGFGGLCAAAQVYAAADGIVPGNYLPYKLLHGLLSAVSVGVFYSLREKQWILLIAVGILTAAAVIFQNKKGSIFVQKRV